MLPEIVSGFIELILSLWWAWVPFLLYPKAKKLYLYTMREMKFFDKIDLTALEIKLPEEVTKSPQAMENVMHVIWGMYAPPSDVKQYWVDGRFLLPVSFDIVSKGGYIHFYIFVERSQVELVKSALYGEYPQVEIEETDDYVSELGRDLPNEDYDLWGADMQLYKPDVYPLRTYPYWENMSTEEDKKIDPLSGLFEVLNSLNPHEEIWIQILGIPLTDDEHPYLEESREIINKIMGRPSEKKKGEFAPLAISKIPWDVWNLLIKGEPVPSHTEEEEEKSELDLGLMRLSPGEQEVLKGIEDKMAKQVYEGNIRFLYIGRRDVFSNAKRIPTITGSFNQFSTQNLNGMKPDKTKTTPVPWFFEKRRKYMKKKKLFQLYVNRKGPLHRDNYIFSTAELATMFHFPSKAVAPSTGLSRAETRKGGAPPELPE